MRATLEIKTADELADPTLEGRWAARRAARETPILLRVLRTFVERGGAIPVKDIMAAFPDDGAAALIALDGDDLIRLREGHIDIAYPFSGVPTAFVVRLDNGVERYACCAIDALGVAPMLAEPVDVRTECHHCGMPLEFPADPNGPGTGAEGLMVWIGKREEGERRIATAL